MLVLKGIFRGSPKITLQNGNNPKRFLGFPKGPFRTKNAMAPKTVVFYYRRSVLL